MKCLFLLLILVLTACATVQDAQTQYVQACAGYAAAIATAVQLRSAGKLTQNEIDSITIADNQITPICTGPLPTDPTAATQQVTAAVTTLLILEAAKKVGK